MEYNSLKHCRLCPRNCGVNRYLKTGVCGANQKISVSHWSLHKWEEPVLSGTIGSGTVFFTNCNLKCLFCQNRKISQEAYGKEISEEKLQAIFLALQNKGAHNINLVTPTMYVPQISSVLKKIKFKDLTIPVIYNTSSYENVETIKMLDGLVDIYLADLKYYDNKIAKNYSNCDNYFKYATLAIDEMYRQVGNFKIDSNGLMTKGLIIRVLVLPGHIDDAKRIISYIFNKYGHNVLISIMNQYTPIIKCDEYPNLNRQLSNCEYDDIINFACDLGIENAFIQEGDTQLESFIPNFDCSNI